MQSPGSRILFSLALTCGAGLAAAPALAAMPTFTVAAASVTMPSGGNGTSSQFTLTSVNGYAGQVRVDCAYSGGIMGAKVPLCGIYVNPVSTLAAGKSVTGSLTVTPYGKTIAYDVVALNRETSRHTLPVLAGALAGLFVAGWRLRRGPRNWLWLLLTGAMLTGLTSCGASMSGTFPYTVTAVDTKTNARVSAPFTVTVP